MSRLRQNCGVSSSKVDVQFTVVFDKDKENPTPNFKLCVHRFRLELIVEDGTEKTTVTVFDEAAEFIVKAKAAELAAQEEVNI